MTINLEDSLTAPSRFTSRQFAATSNKIRHIAHTDALKGAAGFITSRCEFSTCWNVCGRPPWVDYTNSSSMQPPSQSKHLLKRKLSSAAIRIKCTDSWCVCHTFLFRVSNCSKSHRALKREWRRITFPSRPPMWISDGTWAEKNKITVMCLLTKHECGLATENLLRRHPSYRQYDISRCLASLF